MISLVIFYRENSFGEKLHWVKMEFHNRGEEWFHVDN